MSNEHQFTQINTYSLSSASQARHSCDCAVNHFDILNSRSHACSWGVAVNDSNGIICSFVLTKFTREFIIFCCRARISLVGIVSEFALFVLLVSLSFFRRNRARFRRSGVIGANDQTEHQLCLSAACYSPRPQPPQGWLHSCHPLPFEVQELWMFYS